MSKSLSIGCRIHREHAVGSCAACVKFVRTEVGREISGLMPAGGLLRASIVPHTTNLTFEGLASFSIENHARRLKATFAEVDFAWAIFNLDISANEHESGRYSPHVSPHWYGLVAGAQQRLLKSELDARYPSSEVIPNPVRLKPWDGRFRLFEYMFKSDFDRRVGVEASESFDKRTGRIRLSRNTRERDIRAGDRPKLLEFLDRIGVYGRIVVMRAQLRETRSGLRLVLMRQQSDAAVGQGNRGKAEITKFRDLRIWRND